MGETKFDDLNFYDEKNQLWLAQFCKALKIESIPKDVQGDWLNQDQFQKETIDDSNDDDDQILDNDVPPKNRVCLFDLLKTALSRKCLPTKEPNDIINEVCCEQTFPFEPKVLEICMKNQAFLTRYVLTYQNMLYEKLYYNKTNGLISVVEFSQVTPYIWTTNYKTMSEIYKSIEDFFKKQSQYTIVDLSNKIDPNSKKNLAQNGFFVSEFDFYDLQKSILNGTVQSFLITMGVVFIMMLITTRNIMVSLYSLITITLSISATIGTLTLFGSYKHCAIDLYYFSYWVIDRFFSSFWSNLFQFGFFIKLE